MKLEPIVISLLDTDLYKFNMDQVIFHKHTDLSGEYYFKCRNEGVTFTREMFDEINAQIDYLCTLTFNREELDYLRSIRYIKNDYVEFLRLWRPIRDYVETSLSDDGQLEICVKGPLFSAMQFERFLKAADMLQGAFQHHIIRHICNSAGIEHFPERQLDMCRLGLGLYGIDSRDNHVIHNVATLKTTILQLRRVPKEETVGYSRKGILKRDSLIAAIPIGYADGLDRHLGRGRGYCLVNGQPAPYVGNICMDVAMIDVTDIPCHEGDSVEIFGDNLPPTVLAEWLDTIPYEILTSVSGRVKRVYYQD